VHTVSGVQIAVLVKVKGGDNGEEGKGVGERRRQHEMVRMRVSCKGEGWAEG